MSHDYRPECATCPLRRGERPDMVGRFVPNARLTIVLDAPDYEDRDERRWAGGKLGRVLGVWLQKVGLSREQVNITGAHQCVHWRNETDGELKKATALCRKRLVEELKATGAPVLAAGKWAASSVFGKPNVIKWMGAKRTAVDGLEHLEGRITWALPSIYYARGEGRVRAIWNHLAWTAGRGAGWTWPPLHIEPNENSLSALRRMALTRAPIGVDIETGSGDVSTCSITCVGVATEDEAVSLEWPITEPFRGALEAVLRNEHAPKVFHNGTFDVPIMKRHGLTMAGRIEDSMLLHSHVEPLSSHGLGTACAVEFPWDRWKSDFQDLDETIELDGVSFWDRVDPPARRTYNAKDAWAQVKLWNRLLPRAYDWSLYEQAKRLDLLAASMRQEGVPVDEAVRGFMRDGALALRKQAEDACRILLQAEGMDDLNLRSPVQLNKLFFSKWGVTPLRHSEKTGEPSLDAWVLQQLAEMGGVPALMAKALMQYREYDKVLSTFIDGCPVGAEGSAHFDWKIWTTVTGRWSSSPNAQNYPKHLRSMFYSPTGYIVGPDYRQLEVRIIAQQAGVSKLLEAFEKGEDIYRTCAKDLFDTGTVEAVTDSQRKAAKQFVLGGNYGGGSETLWEQMTQKGFKIAWADVDRLLKRYLTVFAPEIPAWHKRTIRQARDDGFVAEPLTGRRRPVMAWTKPTEIVNFPVQAMAGAIANRAICKMLETRHEADRIIFQVHDEITVTGPDLSRLERWCEMCMPMTLRINSIPMEYPVDLKSGRYWGTME